MDMIYQCFVHIESRSLYSLGDSVRVVFMRKFRLGRLRVAFSGKLVESSLPSGITGIP